MEKYTALYIFSDNFINPDEPRMAGSASPDSLSAKGPVLQLVTYALVRNNGEMLICLVQQRPPHTIVV